MMAEKGILHRDLTLDNILVFEGDQLYYSYSGQTSDHFPIFKICDFGVSGTEEDKTLLPRGKMRNYSPEGIKDKESYCSASDLYSFALMIYEMAHNHLVWN